MMLTYAHVRTQRLSYGIARVTTFCGNSRDNSHFAACPQLHPLRSHWTPAALPRLPANTAPVGLPLMLLLLDSLRVLPCPQWKITPARPWVIPPRFPRAPVQCAVRLQSKRLGP